MSTKNLHGWLHPDSLRHADGDDPPTILDGQHAAGLLSSGAHSSGMAYVIQTGQDHVLQGGQEWQLDGANDIAFVSGLGCKPVVLELFDPQNEPKGRCTYGASHATHDVRQSGITK